MILNILHLARTMGQGGAEKIIYQLAVGCESIDRKIVVASCGGVYVESLKKRGISHYFVQDLECKKPQVMLQTLCTLIKVIKKEDIQILHSHHRMAALYGQILKGFFPKLKLVYTAHNVFYDKVSLTSMTLKNTAIVAVGESVKANLMEVFGIEEERIVTIFNAVDIPKRSVGLDMDKTSSDNQILEFLGNLKAQGNTLIGIIGRLSEQKGIDVFIKAMARLVKKYPSAKGIIVGDGGLRSQMETLVTSLNLEDTIYFLGYQKNVTDVIELIDFAAMPSRWEGFPLTPIELFAMGKTLAASDIGGINEIVKDGRNGLLFPKDNEKELTLALEVLFVDEDLRDLLSQQARIDYEESYSYESFLEGYLHLYKTIKNV